MRPNYVTASTYVAQHLVCFGAFYTGLTRADALLLGVSYVLRVFGVMGGYHRYFAHRSFKTSRIVQFALALIGCLGSHRGALWWASHHRYHHRYSDTPRDIHSPMHKPFLYSHSG